MSQGDEKKVNNLFTNFSFKINFSMLYLCKENEVIYLCWEVLIPKNGEPS